MTVCSLLSRLPLVLLVGGLLWGPLPGTPSRTDDPTLQQSLRTVDSLRTAGAFRAALERLSRLSTEHPEAVEVLWRHAILWSDYGLSLKHDEGQALPAFKKGLRWADKALAVDSSSAWAHLAKAAAAGRAALLAKSNRKSVRLSRTVKAHADRAIALDSTLAPAYHIRGVWHGAVADIGFFTRIIVRAIYGGLPDASFEQSVADLKRAIALEPRASSHLELGKVYRKMGRTDAAREQLRAALAVPPRDPFAPEAKQEARTLLDELT